MAESIQHKELVKKMNIWVMQNLINGTDSYVFLDSSDENKNNGTQRVVNGLQPDLYAIDIRKRIIVIGEAKTEKDIDREHSINQYQSFCKTIQIFDGPGHLVFAVPFACKPIMRNIIFGSLKIVESDKMKVHILEF